MPVKVTQLGKKFIGHPDQPLPVVSSKDFLGDIFHNPGSRIVTYLKSLFPILGWITRYNLGWFTGDVIAGFTVGFVLVPQSMSYAQIASLSPEYGLYSSFFGVLTYCLFATSKDVSIGPVAVMSLTVAQIIKHVQASHGDTFSGPEIAVALSFICGFIVLGIGLLRLGWIVEFIPVPAVAGFMTGSAVTIVVGQIPGLMGISGFDTRAVAYEVVINTLKGLPRTTKDAAFGLIGLFALYAIRITCDKLSKKYPRRARIFFFISVCRHAFVIVVLTIAAWLYARHRKTKSGKYPIKLLQDVPRGLKHVRRPNVSLELLSAIAPELPVATIILLLEHIAISKSFGRLNGYTINPNQELIAIGVANTCGSCFGSYPNTGSFSRSALKAKSGVRTPLAGVVTSIVIIVALYGLTPAFFWIPSAGLSAIIIHAVADLVTPIDQAYQYWRVSPVEFIIWLAAVLIAVFSSIENAIYMSICASLAFLLVRVAFPRGNFLGRAHVRQESGVASPSREIFIPLKANGVIGLDVEVHPPGPGVVVYRFEESFLYPNSSLANTQLVSHIKKNFKRGQDLANVKLSDRPWNDPGPPRGTTEEQLAAENEKKDDLKAVVLDFSAISHVDITSIQLLIDTRSEIERWVNHPVEFHFATILSPWIRRALIAGDFGSGETHHRHEIASVVPYRPEPTPDTKIPQDEEAASPRAIKSASSSYADSDTERSRIVASDTPFFHVDLPAAVAAAENAAIKPI